jgi:hypothetical protein
MVVDVVLSAWRRARCAGLLGLSFVVAWPGAVLAEAGDPAITPVAAATPPAQWVSDAARRQGLLDRVSTAQEVVPGVWFLAGRRPGGSGAVWAALACRQGDRLLTLERESPAGGEALKNALAADADRIARACASPQASGSAAPAAPSTASGDAARGWLLLSPPPGMDADAAVLELATGRWRALPRSPLAASYARRADHWTLGGPGLLVRRDGRHQVTGWRLPDLQPVGAFTLGQAVGSREPGLYGELRPSPDGQSLLGVWRPEGRSADRLVALDWQGRVRREWPIEAGADRAWSWLPDGRVLVLRGGAWLALSLDGRDEALGAVMLPPGARWRGAEIDASPDGEHVLAVLATQDAVARGEAAQHRLPYVASLRGGALRPLVRMPPGQLTAASAVARWGTAGLWLLWGGRTGAYGAGDAAASCAEVGWLPLARLQDVVIDGLTLPPALRGPGARQAPLKSCGGRLGVSVGS